VGDFALFRQSLDQAACGDHGGDFSGALRQAADALATVSGHRKEIRIYTDGQATAFTRADELASIAREHPDITIVPVLIGEPPHGNLGIVAMRPEGGIPSIGQPVKFRIEILNSGAAPARDIAVNLKFGDGAPAGTASIPLIAPGETRSASVSVNFQAPGPNSVTAEIPTDSFEADNRVSCAIDVLSRLDAAIVTPDFEAPDQETAAFFLERALVPVPRDQVARHFLAPSRMRLADLPASIGQPNGERPELVFLCDPGPVSDEIAMALFLYIETGGNLVVIPGERGVDGWSEDGMFATLLPAHPSAAQDTESLNWQSSNHSHPVTDLWNDPSNGDLGTVRFSRYHPLSLKPPLNGRAWEAARPIVSFTNGEPAVAEWTYGNGTVILFAANLTREWTNQALHPSFVPFLERLMAHLNRANEARLILRPGETFRKPVAASFTGKDFSVKTPLSPTARTAGQANGEPDGPYVRYSSTDKTGAYEVFIEDEHVATFAVQPDPDESDFSPVEDSILNSLTEVPRDDSSPEARWIVRRDFWPALIWCAAALFLAEAALGHRNSHARQAA